MEQKDFARIEKKVNKVTWRSLIIGVLIGIVYSPNLSGIVIGAVIGVCIIILYNLFASLFSSKETKKELSEWQSEYRNRYEETRSMNQIEKERFKTTLGIKCPTCQSTQVEKIGMGKKLAYVVGFGIIAPAFKKVRSQFQCNNCGYKW